ncbi:hypothetical protein [Frondihabitans sp. VKM Ac-2883]|uniref:hypothetical protein n=1 Tax=Frondihabitans sp. VKM Ac-2883 TaxID=2783823 RepID=UPI00188A4D9D|nr:hypothetical protein [Frondihabitans sp. VKM Ac-2883]
MPSSAWTSVLTLDPERDYVAMATRFEVRSRRHLVAIIGSTQELWQALPTTVGLAGYQFAVSPLQGTLSTLTAWRDRSTLEMFVRGPLHAALVTGTRDLMKASSFADWVSPGAHLPPTWKTANERLDAK